MPKLFDEQGNEVEGAMTKEDIETSTKKAIEDATTAAVEQYKKDNPVAPAVPVKKEDENNGAPDAVATLTKTVEELQSKIRNNERSAIARVYAPKDTAKQEEIMKNFDRVNGFEETPEGLTAQGEAAARLAGIDTTGVSVADLAGAGSTRDISNAPKPSPAGDAAIQKVLGITAEDAAKYGPQAEAESSKVN